ncbi:MAG: hypothetical protein IT338_20230 [Thermomicrobiales bacterium]|nr:hypothetical protein [Thermomicrobiales bacterium]
MAVSLELMDVDAGNLVGSYATIEEALEIVRNAYSRHGEPGVQGLVLLLIREDGSQKEISSDLDLVRLAVGRQLMARPSWLIVAISMPWFVATHLTLSS